MNIFILNQYALPSGSPGITRHGDIGRELVARGHRVTVVASDYDYLARQPGNRPRTSEHNGVQFLWLRTGGYVGNDRRRTASMLRYALSAVRAGISVRPRPDVIIGSSPNLLAPLAAAAAARLLTRPWVFEVRDFWPSALVDLGAIKRNGAVHRTLGFLERRLYQDAQAIVSIPPNGALRMEELQINPEKFTHIPNSTTWPIAPGEGMPSSLSEMVRGLADRFLIVYAGALGVTHDLGTVLGALATLGDKDPKAATKVAILFVGDGVERERTMQMAKSLSLNNVAFHPAVEKAAIRQLLDSAGAGLMHAGSSDYFKYGLSPNKLFDYFAAGKPVLIAAEHPTIVDEAKAGIRYLPGDPNALAEAIRWLVQTPAAEREAMGERGRELVRMRYSTSAITDRYERLLREVVDNHRRG
jgi:glycosyltransferase involved in cell wall biosynthesis